MKRISCFPVAAVALLALLFWLISPRESAATIVITEGTLVVSGNIGIVSISGETRGFSMDGGGNSIGGLCALCNVLAKPGDTLSLIARWSGGDLGGSFTIDGASYPMGSSGFPIDGTTGSGSVDFEGSATAPPMTPEGTATVTAPFSFTGNVQWLPNGPFSMPISMETLAGSGLATIQLVAGQTPLPTWEVGRAIYLFQTPEPGTLLLLGSGLVGLGGMAWRRRRRG